MPAGFLLGILHDRRLMREAQVDLAIRRFSGFGLNDRLPDHSSLTRIRRGAERFRRIFERTVRACVATGVARGQIMHIDASPIRAEVAWESLAVRHVGAVVKANGEAQPTPDAGRALRNSKKTGTFRKVRLPDPDAPIATATADAGYAYGKIFGGLEEREIAAVIPTKAEPIRSPVPLRRFRYGARHDIVKCPRGKVLRPGKPAKRSRFFHSRSRDCNQCELKALCISKGRATKSVVIGDHPPRASAKPVPTAASGAATGLMWRPPSRSPRSRRCWTFAPGR